MLRWIMALALVSFGSVGARATDDIESVRQIRQWVEQLDSPKFEQREEATSKLIAADHRLAMTAVGRTVEHGSPEASTRATHILAMWYRSPDAKARQLVQTTAARLQTSTDPRMVRLGKTIVTRPVPVVAYPAYYQNLWGTRGIAPIGAVPAIAVPHARAVPLRFR